MGRPTASLYAPPAADLALGHEAVADAVSRLRWGWIAALAECVMTLVVFGTGFIDKDWSHFVEEEHHMDLLIVAVLGWGVWRKSRLAAAGLLLFFIGVMVVTTLSSGRIRGALLMCPLAYGALQGLVGTVQYQKLKRSGQVA